MPKNMMSVLSWKCTHDTQVGRKQLGLIFLNKSRFDLMPHKPAKNFYFGGTLEVQIDRRRERRGSAVIEDGYEKTYTRILQKTSASTS